MNSVDEEVLREGRWGPTQSIGDPRSGHVRWDVEGYGRDSWVRQ